MNNNLKDNSEDRVKEAEEVYTRVMDAIITQRLAPSQKVTENVLSDMFGTSRTTSRNLMERLTAQLFLVTVSPRITRVAPLTLLEIKQNFALRRTLVPEMAALSAAKLDFDALTALQEEMIKHLPANNDKETLMALKANQAFNLAICHHAGYPLMIHWHKQLEDTALRIYWFYLKTNHAFPYTMEQEAALVELMKTGNSAQIKKALTDNLSQTEDQVLSSIFANDQFATQNLTVK